MKKIVRVLKGTKMTNLIFIHGVNSQRTGYSTKFYNNILKFYRKELRTKKLDKKTVRNKVSDLVQNEILWADITTDLTNRYLSLQKRSTKRGKRPGKWNFLIDAIDPLVVQILYYVKDKGDKKAGSMQILKKVHTAFKKAYRNDKVVVIAHSLGSVIAFDYLFGFRKYKLQRKVNVEALITMGSPIPVFTAAMGHVDSNAELPPNVKRWENILDPDDGIARYCKKYFKKVSLKEKEINTGWTPLKAHSGYWTEAAVAEYIAKRLVEWGI